MAGSESTPVRKRWRAGQIVSPVRPTYKPIPPPPKPRPLGILDLPHHKTVLGKFWKRAHRRKQKSLLALLREFSSVKVRSRTSYKDRRTAPIRLKAKPHARCFACERWRKTARHHIIQIQHGGPNIAWNLVYLCEFCHAEVHPWLHRTPKLPHERYAPIWASPPET